MKTNTKLLIAEVVLIIASVLIFRSLWLLFDMASIMHKESILILSFVLGIAVAIPALRYLIRKG